MQATKKQTPVEKKLAAALIAAAEPAKPMMSTGQIGQALNADLSALVGRKVEVVKTPAPVEAPAAPIDVKGEVAKLKASDRAKRKAEKAEKGVKAEKPAPAAAAPANGNKRVTEGAKIDSWRVVKSQRVGKSGWLLQGGSFTPDARGRNAFVCGEEIHFKALDDAKAALAAHATPAK